MMFDLPPKPAIIAPAPRLFVAKAPAIIIRGEAQVAWHLSMIPGMCGAVAGFGQGTVEHGAPQTGFTQTLSTNDSSDENNSYRNVCALTFTGTITQVRTTWEGSTAAAFNVDNVAIGRQSSGATSTATPVEMFRVGGGSGFTLSSSGSVTTEWADIPGLFTASGQIALAIADIASTNGNPRIASPGGTSAYIFSSANTYNQSAPGAGSPTGGSYAIKSIEVRT